MRISSWLRCLTYSFALDSCSWIDNNGSFCKKWLCLLVCQEPWGTRLINSLWWTCTTWKVAKIRRVVVTTRPRLGTSRYKWWLSRAESRNFNVRKIAAKELRSFGYLELIVTSGTFKVRFVVLYRPPYSPTHPVTTSTFFTDFADYLETLILSSEPLVNTGDFNVHVDDPIDSNARILLDLSDSLGLCQHVTQSTHELGNTINLITTRQLDSIIHGSPSTDHLFSDHLTVLTMLRTTKLAITSRNGFYRKMKSCNGKIYWFFRVFVWSIFIRKLSNLTISNLFEFIQVLPF